MRAINGSACDWLDMLLNICWRVCYNRRLQLPYALGTLIATKNSNLAGFAGARKHAY